MRKTENLHTEEVAHRKIATTMHTKCKVCKVFIFRTIKKPKSLKFDQNII